ncbi:MAG: methyl-accepting chemotaxis protein [Chloroflexota bacterium]
MLNKLNDQKANRSSTLSEITPALKTTNLNLMDQERQRRKQLLEVLLLISGIGAIILLFLTNIPSLPKLDQIVFVPELLGLFTVVICYLLNRRSFTYLAAIILFLMITLLVVTYIITDSDSTIVNDLQGSATLLIIPVLAAGVVIKPRYSFIFAAIGLGCLVIATLLRAKPEIYLMETPLAAISMLDIPTALIVIVASLSWYFETNLQSLIQQLSLQNQNLITINQELSQKREIEQQLSKEADAFTNQLTRAFTDQHHNTERQLEIVTQFSATLEQLNQLSHSVAKVTQQVAQEAKVMQQVAQTGTNSIRTALNSISVLSEQAQLQATTMGQLYEQALQINQVSELTTELTEEMGLLALNAKIEAAGAGVNARRFGVVADEVQRLAVRSYDYTNQVHRIVEDVQQAIKNSISWAMDSAKETTGAIQGTRSVEEILGGIVAMVENTASLVCQISPAIEEQRDATSKAVQTVHHLSIIASSVSKHDQRILSSLERLNLTVDLLNQPLPNTNLVTRFTGNRNSFLQPSVS